MRNRQERAGFWSAPAEQGGDGAFAGFSGRMFLRPGTGALQEVSRGDEAA